MHYKFIWYCFLVIFANTLLQYFLTIDVGQEHAEISERVPVTISVEQRMKYNEHIPAGFYVLKGGYYLSKKNYHEDMIHHRKPSAYKKKITAEVKLNNKQAYTIIPCPKMSNFSIHTAKK